MSLEVGSIVEGTVTGITNFGAFVQLPTGQTGLVHISEIADTYVHDVREHLKEQDKVKVKILSVNETGTKIGLSIRQAQEGYSPGRERGGGRRGPGHRLPGTFEDKLARFIKDSEERQQDIRRKMNAKRGGRGSRSF